MMRSHDAPQLPLKRAPFTLHVMLFILGICEFVPGTFFCLLSALKGAGGVLRWRRAENSCSTARMRRRDGEVQIKIISPADPSADSRVSPLLLPW